MQSVPNARFEQLKLECGGGDQHACDVLFSESPLGSDSEEFALAHGGTYIPSSERAAPPVGVTPEMADLAGDVFWNGLSEAEKTELCDGVRILGLDLAAAAFTSNAPSISVEQGKTFLQRWCL